MSTIRITTPKVLITFAAAALLAVSLRAADQNEEFWQAARKGDAKTVEALLAKGVDVNTKFRYGATALSYACDRGHVDVVKVLLAHGADVNVKDTFYGSTPMAWAVQKGHSEIVKMLLDKGATGRDEGLMGSIFSGKTDLAKLILEAGGLKPETLSAALARATSSKNDELVALLKKNGAKLAEPKVQVPEEVLKSYEGAFRGEGNPDFVFSMKDGRLMLDVQGQKITLNAQSTTTFQALEFPGIVLTFELKEGKAIGFSMKRGENTTIFTRVEKKEETK